jgi:outer membrane protein
MKRYLIVILTIGILNIQNIIAQNHSKDSIKSFSLKEAVGYALKYNFTVLNAQKDVIISEKKIVETTAIGLPQGSAGITYQDMIEIPVTILPGAIIQSPVDVPVKFGQQFNAGFKATVSQLIFNGSYIVGLQASKTYHQLSTQSLQKTEIEVKQAVTNTYYLVLVLQENKKNIDSTLKSITSTSDEISQMNKQGFNDETDVEQIKLTKLNISNSLSIVENQIDYYKKLLKFQLGIEADREIELTDNLDNLIKEVNVETNAVSAFDINSNIDYKLIITQENLSLLNLKREKTDYLPSVAGFYTYQQNAMRDKFNLFDFSKKWYPTSIIGLSIDIPLFSSGMRHSQVQQAQLQLDKTQIMKAQVSRGLMLEYEQSKSEYGKALDMYKTNIETFSLSKKIYNKTLVKYKNGMSSSTELMEIQRQFLTAQNNYYSSIFNLLGAKSKLDKILTKN